MYTIATQFMWVAAGGAIGAVLRFALAGWVFRLLGTAFPWGTLAVNLVGSFAIGVGWSVTQRLPVAPSLPPFLLVGVLGAFTTFSTYSLETVALIERGETGLGLLYVGVSTVGGVAAVLAGFAAARLLVPVFE